MRLATRYDKLREYLVWMAHTMRSKNMDVRKINVHEIVAKAETLLTEHPANAKGQGDEQSTTFSEGYSYSETLADYTYRISFKTAEELERWIEKSGPQRGWKQGVPMAQAVDELGELTEVK